MAQAREIFRYFNGQKEVCADPMVLEDRWFKAIETVDINYVMDRFYGPDFIHNFDEAGKPIDEDGKPIVVSDEDVNTALAVRSEAMQELLPLIYKLFNSHPLDEDGNGMMSAEALEAFTAWNIFRTRVKKNTDENAKTSSSTDSATGEETRTTGTNSSTPSISTATAP